MCEYCQEWDRKDLINTRTKLSRKAEKYPGIEVSIDYDNTLYIGCCADVYEPAWEEASVKINFCPMCGRDLRVKESED